MAKTATTKRQRGWQSNTAMFTNNSFKKPQQIPRVSVQTR
jgi:hypothetical protein